MRRSFLFCLSIIMLSYMPHIQAQRKITAFSEKTIRNGSTATIDGKKYSEPDIIYTDDGNGGYKATRLTVVPRGAEDVTRPYLNNVTAHAACIHWKTSKMATGSTIRIGTRADELNKTIHNTSKQLSATYYWNTAIINDLQPATTYYYQVESNGVTSSIYQFRTMPLNGDKGKFRILLLGDHQRNEHSDYEWMLKAAHQKANELYGEATMGEHFRLILNVGDQVDRGEVTEYEMKHLYKSRSVMSSLPIMTTVGNHETKGDGELQLYNDHFTLYGQLDYQGIKSATANYYAYQTGALLIIVLNTDGTTNTQKEWVKKVVEAADQDPTVTFIMVSQHRPLYAEQWCNDVSPWMKNQIMPILTRSSKFILDYAGHHHLYARGQMPNSPVYHIISGGGVGTTVSGYEQLWGTTPDNRDEEAVQKTIDQWTYQIAEFDPETQTMKVDCYSIGNSRLALDNELVDSFSRCLSNNIAPDTPQLQEPDASHFPINITQKAEAKALHSAEYQLATDEDFQKIVLDKVITFEDYYGVDDKFMPKNLNSSDIVTTLSLEDGSVAQGKFYARCRNRNMNLNWSGYSTPIEINVTAQSSLPTIQLDKRIYGTGEPITLHYQNAPVGKNAWVGLYESTKEPIADSGSKVWAYTTEANGTLTMNISDPGEYYAVLFADGGYRVIAGRIPFIVTNNCNETDKPFSMEMKQDVLATTDDIVVRLANAPCLPHDWVGVYDIQQIREGEPITNAQVSYIWAYADQPTQELNLSKGTVNTQPSPGYYFAEYFFAGQYTSFFPRQYFIIGQPAVISASKTTFTANEAIVINYKNLPGWKNCRMVICNEYGHELETISLDGEKEGEIEIASQKLATGRYTAHITYGTSKKAISPIFSFTLSDATGIKAVDMKKSNDMDGKYINNGKLLIRKNCRLYNSAGIRLD